MFLKVVLDRMEETLVHMVFQHIEPSTTIMIDCWTARDTVVDLVGLQPTQYEPFHKFLKNPLLVLKRIPWKEHRRV
jgi:hypothetical protein